MKIYYSSKSKIKHLGAKAVNPKYAQKLNFQEIGIGYGQNFILIKNIMDFLCFLKGFPNFYQLILNFYFIILINIKKKNLLQRVLGFLMLCWKKIFL